MLIGTVPTNTPTTIASLWADYTFKTGPLTGFGFGGGVRYNGVSYADQTNLLTVPEYVVGDATVHYEYQNWRFQLNVTNIADNIYVGSCQRRQHAFTQIDAARWRAWLTNGRDFARVTSKRRRREGEIGSDLDGGP